MPIHDWTRVDAGLFHAFHQGWISALSRALNTGGLPPDHFALLEQTTRRPLADFLTYDCHMKTLGRSERPPGWPLPKLHRVLDWSGGLKT